MRTRQVTIAILSVAIIVVLVWDIIAASNGIEHDTVSEVVLGCARRVWTLPIALGVVMGHLVWPISRSPSRIVTAVVLSTLGALSILLDVVRHPSIMPVVPFVFGMLVGHFVWGQQEE